MIVFLLLFSIGYAVFIKFNMGLSRQSRGQQLRRYLLGAIQTVLPMEIAQLAACGGRSFAELQYNPYAPGAVVAALVTAILWMTAYNIVYDRSHRSSSPDYDNHMDIAFGIYLFGWLTGVHFVLSLASPVVAAVVVGIAETALIIIPVAQIAYYAVYRTNIDDAGMQPLLNTYWTEAVEFVRSFPLWKTATALAATIAVAAVCVYANTFHMPAVALLPLDNSTPSLPALCGALVVLALTIYFSIYIWKPRHGLFVRTGIMALYIDVRDYNRGVMRYRSGMKQRLASLRVETNTKPAHDAAHDKPHTIIMVIGESACRDYMSAFQPDQPWQTTPWESDMRRGTGSGFIFFPNAYSCAMQTVPSLERVLTERNQYNGLSFADSCSVVDIARAAGYRVSWYSNQSYIGINDTSVTLVAQTADTAKWVKKEGGAQQFDESLLSFLDEIKPEDNNFVVLHLKGSHFNYENRYPAAYAAEHGLRTDGGDVECYRNSIHYTDTLLHRVFDYARERLNLHAMVYFSDHGGIPDMRRSPRFLGFKMVRIPLWAYLADDYRKCHPQVAEALETNRQRYFTNDLVYELMCGIFDIKSNHYDPSQSLASTTYRYRRDDLLTYDGRIRIADDDLDTD